MIVEIVACLLLAPLLVLWARLALEARRHPLPPAPARDNSYAWAGVGMVFCAVGLIYGLVVMIVTWARGG